MGMPMGEDFFNVLLQKRAEAKKSMGLPEGRISNKEFDSLPLQEAEPESDRGGLQDAAMRRLNQSINQVGGRAAVDEAEMNTPAQPPGQPTPPDQQESTIKKVNRDTMAKYGLLLNLMPQPPGGGG